MIVITSIPNPEKTSLCVEDFRHSIASLTPSSTVRSFLYCLSSRPRMYGIPDEMFAS